MTDLKYTLAAMEEALTNANNYTKLYSEAINTLDSTINAMAANWKSAEVGTYEAFVEKYNAKKQSLYSARDHMVQFCKKLDERITTFSDTAQSIKSSFN